MVLILQIAIGVVLGYLAIEYLRARRRKRHRLQAAYKKGGEFGEAMSGEIKDKLHWSVNDLKTRFINVLEQRLTIFEMRIDAGQVDPTTVLNEEIAHYSIECDDLFPVIRRELERVAHRWLDGVPNLEISPEDVIPLFEPRIRDGIEEIKTAGVALIRRRFSNASSTKPGA